MKKIIIFIGEGGSEYSFFKELLIRDFNLLQHSTKDSPLYVSGEHFVLFGHYGGGDKELMKKLTYSRVNIKIRQHEHIFGNLHDYELYYVILTDTDSSPKNKLKKAKEHINSCCSSYPGEFVPILPERIIETWFLCGIGSLFESHFPGIDKKKLKAFLKKDVEKVEKTKDLLNIEILNGTEIGGGGKQETVGREFGKYIDVKLAAKRSNSFNVFYKKIEELLT